MIHLVNPGAFRMEPVGSWCGEEENFVMSVG
jgi:hypothetical protein